MKNSVSLLCWFVGSWLLFQVAFISGQHFQDNFNRQQFIASIEKRVALDLPKLNLANTKFKIAADPLSIKDYLHDLNQTLMTLESPIRVVSLQGIKSDVAPTLNVIKRSLETSEQAIQIEIQTIDGSWSSALSAVTPALALLFTLLVNYYRRQVKTLVAVNQHTEPLSLTPKLHINLADKSINFGTHNEPVVLSNKPFCFYAALVDYCLNTDMPNLKHNNDVPDDLLQLANKYFFRLIELGHTKRKRPDFSANLDKTLSEIRSALDEVFKNNIEHKEAFYPPKAQGEGSRSKMHNYAIFNRDPNLVEFVGK